MTTRLKHEREKRGWSRAELARRAVMSASDVGKIEAGRAKPYESQLKKIARALGIRVIDAPALLDEEIVGE
jgi:ribosome-binding protein aMBF1 (putative translation factor)